MASVNTTTKLGAMIARRGLKAVEVCYATKIHVITMSKYCNLREPIRPHHLLALSQFFECEPEELLGVVE